MSPAHQLITFLLCLALVLATRGLLALRPAARRGSAVRRGPVPGYARLDADAVDTAALARTVAPLADRSAWRPVRLETFHGPWRRRVVLGVDADDPSDELLVGLARGLAASTRANVAAIELVTDVDASPSAGVVFSADDAGWSGRPGDGVLLTWSADAADLRHAVEGIRGHDGVGWHAPPLGPAAESAAVEQTELQRDHQLIS